MVVNVYCPRADPERADRLSYKMRFYRLLHIRCTNFLNRGHHVVVVGDVNTSHREIDHCDPYEVRNSGLNSLLNGMGQWISAVGFRCSARKTVVGSLPSIFR